MERWNRKKINLLGLIDQFLSSSQVQVRICTTYVHDVLLTFITYIQDATVHEYIHTNCIVPCMNENQNSNIFCHLLILNFGVNFKGQINSEISARIK